MIELNSSLCFLPIFFNWGNTQKELATSEKRSLQLQLLLFSQKWSYILSSVYVSHILPELWRLYLPFSLINMFYEFIPKLEIPFLKLVFGIMNQDLGSWKLFMKLLMIENTIGFGMSSIIFITVICWSTNTNDLIRKCFL